MKILRSALILLAVVAAFAGGLMAIGAKFGISAAIVAYVLADGVGRCLTLSRNYGATTLTSPEILLDVIKAFTKRLPFITRWGTDFRAERLKLNQSYTAHIAGIPSVSTYDTTTGYANGATAARGLLTDLPITVDQHPTCPLKWLHLDNIKDNKMKYAEVIGNAGYALGKGVVDNVLGAVNGRNFSKERGIATADADYDLLTLLTGDLNSQGALNSGRILLVNTDVANTLAADARIISKDYAGQLVGGDGYRQWFNVGGFALIQEYPDLPLNNATALTGVTGANTGDLMTKTAHGLETGDPVKFVSGTTFTGLTAGTRYFAIKASADTFQVATTRAEAIAGTAVALTADGTAGVFQRFENLIAIAFESRAFAILAGIPDGFNSELAGQLGITETMTMESITDPNTGISMAAVKWQLAGTGDLIWCPTFVWGKSLGKQGAAATAGALTDYAAVRVYGT